MTVAYVFSEDQGMLADSVARFLERDYPPARRRAALTAGFDEMLWQGLANLGLFGALFDEDQGGFGGPVETMALFGPLGRHMALAPVLECMVTAGSILAASTLGPDHAEALTTGTMRPALATLEGQARDPWDLTAVALPMSGGMLSGAKRWVQGGDAATHFLVTARDGGALSLWLVAADAPGVSVTSSLRIDGHGIAEVTFDSSPGTLVASGDEAARLLSLGLDRGAMAACAQAVGEMDALMEATPEYLRGREQYGVPLASFQALQHRMADMFVALECARSLCWHGTLAFERPEADRRAAVAAALVQVGRSARFIGQQAVQLHGGMGMSEEMPVAHHFLSLTTFGLVHGAEPLHLRRFEAATEPERT